MRHRQRGAVHGHGQQRVPAVQDRGQRGARGEAVGGGAQQLVGAGPRPGGPQQAGQAGAEPLGVPDVGAGHRVGDAAQRDPVLDQRALQQLVVVDGDLALHHPVDAQLPGLRRHLGQDQRGVHPVEARVRGDERAQALDVEVHAGRAAAAPGARPSGTGCGPGRPTRWSARRGPGRPGRRRRPRPRPARSAVRKLRRPGCQGGRRGWSEGGPLRNRGTGRCRGQAPDWAAASGSGSQPRPGRRGQ